MTMSYPSIVLGLLEGGDNTSGSLAWPAGLAQGLAFSLCFVGNMGAKRRGVGILSC